MRVGILPAAGAGLRTMASAGQLTRLTEHVTAYQQAGHLLTYFSSLPDDLDWIVPVIRPATAHSGRNTIRRALLRPLREPVFRRQEVLRGMSLLGSLSAITARLVYGTPFVVSCGADYERIARLHGRPAWKWHMLRRLAFRLAAAVIVPNPEHVTALRGQFPRAPIVHVPNWVDCDRFRPSPRPIGTPTVLYVGRLVIEKNLDRLARVCSANRWRLICLGAGPERDRLRAWGAECPGAVPYEQLPAWHAQAHVFCLPSLTEGQPKALLEAMASGLPCAVSYGVTGLVRFGYDAAGFAAVDEGAMAQAIAHLLAKGDEYGARARETALRYRREDVLPQEIRVVEQCAR